MTNPANADVWSSHGKMGLFALRAEVWSSSADVNVNICSLLPRLRVLFEEIDTHPHTQHSGDWKGSKAAFLVLLWGRSQTMRLYLPARVPFSGAFILELFQK